jgi:predicted HTH domain antitoxin
MAVGDPSGLEREARLRLLLADVDLHEQHVVALGEACRAHARKLSQFELEIVERRHRRASLAS